MQSGIENQLSKYFDAMKNVSNEEKNPEKRKALLMQQINAITAKNALPKATIQKHDLFLALDRNKFDKIKQADEIKAIILNIEKQRSENPSATVDVEDKFGNTPLIIAARQFNLEAVNHLIKAGANVNHTNNSKNTALIYSASDDDFVKLLLDAGANPNLVSKSSTSALMIASLECNLNSVNLLIKAGALINTTMFDGFTPLMEAVIGGSAECVAALIEAKADVTHKTEEGDTALKITQRFENREQCAALILQAIKKISPPVSFEATVKTTEKTILSAMEATPKPK